MGWAVLDLAVSGFGCGCEYEFREMGVRGEGGGGLAGRMWIWGSSPLGSRFGCVVAATLLVVRWVGVGGFGFGFGFGFAEGRYVPVYGIAGQRIARIGIPSQAKPTRTKDEDECKCKCMVR